MAVTDGVHTVFSDPFDVEVGLPPTATIATPLDGALFRGGDAEAFMRAWHELPALDPAAKDMLWHLHLPRLGLRTTKDTLVELHEAVREPMPHVDLRRLAPHLTRAFGEAYTQRAIERAIRSTTNERARAELVKLLKSL